MKKFILFLVLVLSFVSVSSARNHTYNYYTEMFSWSILGDYNHANDMKQGGIGVSMNVYNVHADFTGWPRMHASDSRVDKWSDSQNFNFHVGYRINMGCVGFTPIVGMTNISEGTTDGSHYSVTSNGINNSYKAKNKVSELDYGVVLDYNYRPYDAVPGFKISVGVTKYNAYIGLGMAIFKN